MAVISLYSKRRKRQDLAGKPRPYEYKHLPNELREQVIYIWQTAIGEWHQLDVLDQIKTAGLKLSNDAWQLIKHAICRELGLRELAKGKANPWEECKDFLRDPNITVDSLLDLIEVSFQVIDRNLRRLSATEKREANIAQDPDDAIEELNARFREHGVGYRFESKIIRVDSEYLHAQVVKPAIQLLHAEGFKGAEDEFMEAHERYRKGRNKDAIVWTLKAFESTMKSICDEMSWTYDKGASAKTLINVCLGNNLIPQYLQSHLSGLRSTLESGLPTVRSKSSAHGQGSKPVRVPSRMAAYALHLAATNIVFLVECYKVLKK